MPAAAVIPAPGVSMVFAAIKRSVVSIYDECVKYVVNTYEYLYRELNWERPEGKESGDEG